MSDNDDYPFLYPLIYYNDIYKKYVCYYKNYIYKPNLLIKLMMMHLMHQEISINRNRQLYYSNKIKDILKSIVINLFIRIIINKKDRNFIKLKHLKYYHYYNCYLSFYLSNKEFKEFNDLLKLIKIFNEKY